MDTNEIENSPELRELFVALGKELAEQEMAFGDFTDSELEHSGRRFWKWNRDKIRSLICTNTFLTKHAHSDEAGLIAAITDILSQYPYLSLIRIVLRIGITRFCQRPSGD